MKVLIVEDKVGQPLLKVLEKWGYEVLLAEDGEKAWEILKETPIQFFLVDWMLPGISGLELVQKIRELEQYRDTPVVMISSRTRREDIIQTVRAGIDGYIAKPFTPAQLKQKIEEILRKKPAGAGRNERIEQIIEGHEAFDPIGASPLILFCFGAVTRKDLAVLEEPYFGGLSSMISEIDSFNEAHPRPKLGYLLMESTNQIAQMLRRRSIRRRTRIIVLASTCRGNHLLLIRILVYRQMAGETPFLLVCDRLDELPLKIQEIVEQEGLAVMECPPDIRQWRRYLEKHVAKEKIEE